MKKLITVILLTLGGSAINAQSYFAVAEISIFTGIESGTDINNLVPLTDYTEIYVVYHRYFPMEEYLEVKAFSTDAPSTGVRIELEAYSSDTTVTTDGWYFIEMKGLKGEQIIILQSIDEDYWGTVIIKGFRGSNSCLSVNNPIGTTSKTYNSDEFSTFMENLSSTEYLPD